MRMHKAWTWVGAFGPELMLCAATRAGRARARAAWWAVWDGERLHERTYRRAGPVDATPARVHVPGVLDLRASSRARRGPSANGRDLDAQAPRARARHGARPARSTCPGWSTSRRAATRARWSGVERRRRRAGRRPRR